MTRAALQDSVNLTVYDVIRHGEEFTVNMRASFGLLTPLLNS